MRKKKQEGGNEKKPPVNKPKQDRKGIGGRSGKYQTHIEPYLSAIAGMMRAGATMSILAERFNVAEGTLYEYQKRHPEFKEVLKTNAQIANFEVENALFEMAKTDKVAAFFWLKNRDPNRWKDKQHVFSQNTQVLRKDYEAMTDEELEREAALYEKIVPDEPDEPDEEYDLDGEVH